MTKNYRVSNFILITFVLFTIFVFFNLGDLLFSVLSYGESSVPGSDIAISVPEFEYTEVGETTGVGTQVTISQIKIIYWIIVATTFAALAILLSNIKVVFTGDRVVINSTNGLIISSFLVKKITIPTSEIKKLKIVRNTPLGPDLIDFSKLNWRDSLIIDGYILKGYVYRNLGDLYQEIIKVRPDLKTDYQRVGLAENINSNL